ncbi:uncharacterized protein LY89DRAFT_681359 [Mollisia scopiformis]|uniref:NADH dehydrogenase [ubiquinone] 1 alpha subcomplex assembly factor 3 n=1 Tax=Mollisia scopiformis TaxID=149040 RepID=A0A194XQM5_MOLSC|nr:uncharacterized protein LY89DRAFT_681359 [Mollisia scopiformis]KUJ22022.1 hypothetical protein LY89DRAFT_681359 [Mollisia scopiformis]
MPSIRPISRPTIRELSNFLLSPPTQPRCISHLTRRAPHPPKLPSTPRNLSSTSFLTASPKPQTRDRGPASTEDTQTDFGALNVLGNTPIPSTSIDACLWDGFHLDSGVKITGGTGVLLIAGEAFSWRPWEAVAAGGEGSLKLVNGKGQWDVGEEAWGVLELVWPKPDLLILGLGKDMRPISPRVRQYINSLGIRVDIQDTRNAAAQYNLLATERGIGNVAAALVPIGWREDVGVAS